MSLNLFLSLLALGAAVALSIQSSGRSLAIAAVAAAGVQALLQFHLVSIRLGDMRAIAWAVLAALGVILFLRQNARVGAALATTIVLSAGLPLAIGMQLLR